MSDKSNAPLGGEALNDELKAKLALLARLEGLGLMADLTAQVEKKEADVKVALTKGAVQKAVHVLTTALKDENIVNSRLTIDWGMAGEEGKAGKVVFRYGPRRKSAGTSNTKNGRMVAYNGKLYENSGALAAEIGGMPVNYQWGAATWLKRSAKVEFIWLDKDAAVAAIASGKYKMAEGNTIE